MTPVTSTRTDAIRNLNDRLRSQFIGGEVVITQGVHALGAAFRGACAEAVRAFRDYDYDNDPEGEHDFGAVTVLGRRVFWKIDYYDRTLQYASPDPSDPAVTTRVLTILLASEY